MTPWDSSSSLPLKEEVPWVKIFFLMSLVKLRKSHGESDRPWKFKVSAFVLFQTWIARTMGILHTRLHDCGGQLCWLHSRKAMEVTIRTPAASVFGSPKLGRTLWHISWQEDNEMFGDLRRYLGYIFSKLSNVMWVMCVGNSVSVTSSTRFMKLAGWKVR